MKNLLYIFNRRADLKTRYGSGFQQIDYVILAQNGKICSYIRNRMIDRAKAKSRICYSTGSDLSAAMVSTTALPLA